VWSSKRVVQFSIQKREPQWLHCSFRCPSICWSTCRSAKGYRKSHKAMCYPTSSWSFVIATQHHLTCRATFIINRAWWACFISTTRALACYSAFSNNRWAISVIHHVSSCWAPLHIALSKTSVAWQKFWRSWVATRLSLSFAYLRGTPWPCLQFFQSETKWNQALKTQ